MGPSFNTYTLVGVPVSAVLPPLTVAGADITGLSYDLSVGAEFEAKLTNNSNQGQILYVDGFATVALENGSGATLATAFVSGSQGTYVGPNSSTMGFAFGNEEITGLVLPASVNPGTWSLVTSGTIDGLVSNPVVKVVASANGTYSYTTPGETPINPILPSSVANNVFTFSNAPSGSWIDPQPTTNAFEFDITTPGATFTEISGLPTGFSGVFTVSSGGVFLGTVAAGQTFTFATPVTSFVLSGITPAVTTGNTTAFPIELMYSQSTVNLTMEPVAVPEPGSLLLMAAGLAAIVLFGRMAR